MPKISPQDLQQRRSQIWQDSVSSFNGGMNLLDADTDIQNNEYEIAFNVSNRYSGLKPFNRHQTINNFPTGVKQGILAFGSYIVVFVKGFAYYQNVFTGDTYKVENFYMSPTVNKFNLIVIPAATSVLNRRLTDATTSTVELDAGSISINGSPAGLLVQDGVNQPWIIFIKENGQISARRTYTYDQWTPAFREYVPIGHEMIFVDGILWIVSEDRKSLYRSVTNRPLDFVVSVDENGNKAPDPDEGDAKVSLYAVSYSNNIALYPYSATSFIVSTDAPYSYIVNINRDKLVWGEPTFSRDNLFPSAIINNHSVIDNLGDTVYISPNGIYSFNASRTLNTESNNTIFNKNIVKLFDGIVQDENSCVIELNQYLLFSVETIYGSCILIRDQITNTWASVIYMGETKIKQFVSLMPHYKRVYAITTAGEVLYIFGSADYFTGFVKPKAWAFNELNAQHKIDSLYIHIDQQQIAGAISATGLVDNTQVQAVNFNDVNVGDANGNYSAEFPINVGRKGNYIRPFIFKNTPRVGYKISYLIQWSGGGELSGIMHQSVLTTPVLNNNEQVKIS